jgi:hypothetical protein
MQNCSRPGRRVTARLTWSCNEVEGDLIYRSTVLIDVDPSAKQVVLIGPEPNAPQALVDASQTEVKISTPPPPLLHVILRYVDAGIEHIFLGYDHVAFLIAIVLWARRYGRSSRSSPPSRWRIQ